MHSQFQEAVTLRKSGKSYREIAQCLGVAKSSVSRWCKSISLSASAKTVLQKKSSQSWEKLAEYNRQRANKRQEERAQISGAASKEISKLSGYELCLVGAALYWGEGWKKTHNNSTPTISLGNGDPFMIKVFLRFLREIVEVPEEKIKASVQIHSDIKQRKAVVFWQKVTNIPNERFFVRHQISKASQGKRSPFLLPYGTLEIRVNDYKEFWRIKGWIDALAKEGDA